MIANKIYITPPDEHCPHPYINVTVPDLFNPPGPMSTRKRHNINNVTSMQQKTVPTKNATQGTQGH